MTEGIPKLWTYEQSSRHQLRAPILTRSVPKLPFCCLVKSLDTTQQHRDQMLQHSAPKLAIDCIGFLQQSKRYKEICKYIYICIWNTADLYYSNRALSRRRSITAIELGNFNCVQLRSRHWQKKNALHPHIKSLISCVEGTEFYRSTLFRLSKGILCKTCSMLRLDLRSKLPQWHAATASAALTTLGHQVKRLGYVITTIKA